MEQGLDEGCKEIDIIHRRLCKKILGIPRLAANGVQHPVCCKSRYLGRDSRRGKVLCLAVKYWQRTLQMDKEGLVTILYEWQVNNLEFDS
jgi:hypothetical protein